MNKVLLLGRLTKDPELQYSQSGKAKCTFNLAVNRKYTNQNGEREADFISCVAFGKAGEFAENYFKKGQQVSVIGRPQVRSWDDKEGKKHWTTEVVIEEQYFAEGRAASGAGTAGAGQSAGEVAAQEGFYPVNEDAEDEDLPF